MTDDTPDHTIRLVLADGVIGAVSGLLGSIALFGTLLAASTVGAFTISELGRIAFMLNLNTFLTPDQTTIAGVLIFIGGGMVTWPLVLASIGQYLPGANDAQRGLLLGGVMWTGFAVAHYDGFVGPTLAGYVLATLLGHLGYGVITGAAMDRLFGDGRPYIAEHLGRQNDPVSKPTTARTAPTTDTDDQPSKPTNYDDTHSTTPPRNSTTASSEPAPHDMPPLLQFDHAIENLEQNAASNPASLPALKNDYTKLQNSPRNRRSIASDMRPTINALNEEVHNPKAKKWISSIENRLKQYISARGTDTLNIGNTRLTDDNDVERDITDLQEDKAHITTTIVNQGESKQGAQFEVTFFDNTGVELASKTASLGYIGAGDKKTLNTGVYVPSIAATFTVTPVEASTEQEFLEDVGKPQPDQDRHA